MNKIVLCVLALILLPAALWAADEEKNSQESLVLQVQNRAIKTTDMQADFVRLSRYVAVGNNGASEVAGTGRLYWATGLKLRLEQKTPANELVVANGVDVWWVRPERNRAEVYPVGQFTSSLRSILDVLGGLSGIQKDFEVEPSLDDDLSGQPDELTLVLKPRQPRADLNRLVLWFDKASLELRGFRFSNVVGDTTEYRFKNTMINQNLAASLFTYTPPAGYRVSDQRPRN